MLVGALRENHEDNLCSIYMTLTWLDFNCFELREENKTHEERSSSSISSLSKLPGLSNIPSDSEVGAREASELDHSWLRQDFLVPISMLLSLSNNQFGSSAAWGS
jgi:hypothetical protein